MTRRENSNFIVFTTNRSGSVWVMSTLNSLPQVTAQGELFLPRERVSDQRWDSDFAIPRFIETDPDGFPVRPFTVFSYLSNLYRTEGIVGFKLMYKQLGQYPEILAYLIINRVNVVHLVRKNHLDVLLSYAFKAEIGQAHLLSGQSAPENIQVTLDAENILNQMEQLERKQNLARHLLRWSGLRHMEITYEDLVGDHGNFNLVLSFLSIDPEKSKPTSSVVKIRKGDYRDSIKNYNEVKNVMQNSKFASLIS